MLHQSASNTMLHDNYNDNNPHNSPLSSQAALTIGHGATRNSPKFIGGMLEEVDDSATKEMRTNEDYSAIYGLSDDVLKHCFGYVGSKQYGFVAGTSNRFRKVYPETFEYEALTSIDKATASIVCAETCLAERT